MQLLQLAKPSLEQPPLRILDSQRQCALVGGARFGFTAQPPEQIRSGGVREVILPQLATREDRIDERQAVLRSIPHRDRKSTRLNSSHVKISYAVFCLK